MRKDTGKHENQSMPIVSQFNTNELNKSSVWVAQEFIILLNIIYFECAVVIINERHGSLVDDMEIENKKHLHFIN